MVKTMMNIEGQTQNPNTTMSGSWISRRNQGVINAERSTFGGMDDICLRREMKQFGHRGPKSNRSLAHIS
jgi:hypothetical protein